MNILLLEDDLILSAELCKFLESNNFTCDKIYDGETFLRQIKNNSYDLYLLDINVPKINGLDVCQTIRSFDKNTPIIIISAYGDLSDKKDAFTRLADDYLVKPFAMPELFARLRVIERRLGTAATHLIKLQQVELDTSAHKVQVEGEVVGLSRREFMLLKELMESAGRIKTREQLEASLYAWGEEVASNALEVHISNLRKKLPKDFIKTLRGVGYSVSMV